MWRYFLRAWLPPITKFWGHKGPKETVEPWVPFVLLRAADKVPECTVEV